MHLTRIPLGLKSRSGTRPEIIRLSRVITLLDQYTEHVLVHTGQNYDYELNQVFFDELELRAPDHFLNAAASSAIVTIGQILIAIDPLLAKEAPDALLVLGDTNSCLAAVAAKRRKIPVFHMEAGNRCFDQRVPEEVNRKIVDHISDINMPYSEHARAYLLREGIPPERVIKTGSPMHEVLRHYLPKAESSQILTKLDLRPLEYFVVSAHREENVDVPENLEALSVTLRQVAEKYHQRIIVSTHPRTRQRIDAGGFHFHPLVEFMKPLGLPDYVQLQRNARAVLSDSGSITEESSILNFPALNIREAHERPEGMDEGAVMLTGLRPERVMEALEILADQPRGEHRLLRQVPDYLPDNVSHKVLRIITSYTDYINRTVWRKQPPLLPR